MTVINTGMPMPPAMPPEPIERLTVNQYHEMVRNGILTEDNRVELLEGWLVRKMTKRPPHTIATDQVRDFLARLFAVDAAVRAQEPITTEDSEPEPDVGVARGKKRDYLARHPLASEVLIIVEVADASLSRDRTLKKVIYARARIPVYWIVNLIDRQIEVYTDPTGPAEEPTYRQRQDYLPGDSVPVIVDGQEVGWLAVSDLLP